MADHSPIQNTLAGLICISATLMCVPGVVLYLAIIVALRIGNVDLSGNLLAPLLLAIAGLMLGILAVIGLISGLLQRFRKSSLNNRMLGLCLWLNTLAIVGLAILALVTPQFE